MANTFSNASAIINSTPGTVVYTVPAGVTSVVHTLMVANTSGAMESVSVEFIDNSASATFILMSNIPVDGGSTLYLPKPVNMSSNDSIRVVASNAGTLTAYLSILEMT